MAWSKAKISSFLRERADRIRPETANEMGLNRLEKIDFSGNIHIGENQSTRTGMILIKKGDLVISGINVEKGALAVYEGEEDLLATIHYSSYSYNKSKIDIEFLKWFLKSQSFKNILLAQTRGGIKTELKPKRFLLLEVILPDLDTQIEIRNKLNSVNDEVNEATQVQYENEKLIQKLRQAILTEVIRGMLVPQDPNDEPASVLLEKIKAEKQKLIKEKKIKKEKPLPPITKDDIPFKIPNSWEWMRLRDLLAPLREISYGIIKLGLEPLTGGVCVLRCSDVKYRYIDLTQVRQVVETLSNEYSRTLLQGGELLMNIRGTLGGCAVVPKEIAGYNIAREVAMIPLAKVVNAYYILDVISSPYIQENTISNLRGIAYKGLNLGLLRDFLIPVPPEKEQSRIVKKVDELMGLCDELEKQVADNQLNSERLMDAILREAFAHEA